MLPSWSRREFLEFMGRSSALAFVAGSFPACTSLSKTQPDLKILPFLPLAPTATDDLTLAQGFHSQIIMSWGQTINSAGETFGFNSDYINWVPVPGRDNLEIIMWVNHESVDPRMINNWYEGEPRTRSHVVKEMKAVGGSLIHLKKTDDKWEFVKNSSYNRRISAETPIPLVAERKIRGSLTAIGTLANCAGGKTPDNKILTCEENYQDFYGDVSLSLTGERSWSKNYHDLGWHQYFNRPPEHYGWVVEVDPFTGASRKLTALGRMAHECATVTVASDGRWVAYTGDDKNDQCLYKFISSSLGQLERGTLYVADLNKGQWIALDINQNEKLKARFKDQTDLLIQTRVAADLVGGSKLDRPEDIEIDSVTGDVFVTLTNNKPKGNLHGSILKIHEENGDPTSLSFKSEVFLAGGEKNGFSCPDNLAFDPKGNLWITTDISGGSLNKNDYVSFGNNGLFYIPMSGPNAGFVFQVASAPNGAELTGPCFSPDGKSLFLSVQHPGENSKDLKNLTSHWPDGGNSLPRSSVVEVRGPLLNH